jgi:glycosyltransferase involved in cell wall biosynthesis
MSDPFVSIVLPVYNGGDFLSKAIKSILLQTYKNFEFIIINDGSTDSSEEIIRSFNDSRIRYIRNDMNRGLIYTLNKGVAISAGEFIFRMDADDISPENRLRIQLDYLVSNPDVLAVGGSLKVIGNDELINFENDFRRIKSSMLFESPIAHPALACRAAALKKIGYNSEYYCAEDFKLFADISKLGIISNVEDIVLHYRKHETQISQKNFETQKHTHTRIVLEQLEEYFKIIGNPKIFFKYFSYSKLTFGEYLHFLSCYGIVIFNLLFNR